MVTKFGTKRYLALYTAASVLLSVIWYEKFEISLQQEGLSGKIQTELSQVKKYKSCDLQRIHRLQCAREPGTV